MRSLGSLLSGQGIETICEKMISLKVTNTQWLGRDLSRTDGRRKCRSGIRMQETKDAGLPKTAQIVQGAALT